VKRKKTGVRSTRKTSARPTRAKAVKAGTLKLREGGRQSPFHSEWKYLDVGDLAARGPKGNDGRASGGKGKTGHETVRALPSRSGRPAAAREVTYYEPPPKRMPFRNLTDEQVIAWYLARPGEQRRTILENAATWKWFNNNRRDHKKLIAMHELIKANAVATPPSTTEIATYLRQLSGPPCSCGWMGYPFENHTLDVRKCFKHPPAELLIEEDDDLPF
jgi:hypothetical protein